MARLTQWALCLWLFLPMATWAESDSSLDADASGEEAKSAVMAWLASVDEGQYKESWDSGAELFKQQVTTATWVEALTITRKPLGGVVERTLISQQTATELPNVPAGQYVVLQFKTRFEERDEAAEMVTVVHEGDDWKIVGYFIR